MGVEVVIIKFLGPIPVKEDISLIELLSLSSYLQQKLLYRLTDTQEKCRFLFSFIHDELELPSFRRKKINKINKIKERKMAQNRR
jgi:hypothetical protein